MDVTICGWKFYEYSGSVSLYVQGYRDDAAGCRRSRYESEYGTPDVHVYTVKGCDEMNLPDEVHIIRVVYTNRARGDHMLRSSLFKCSSEDSHLHRFQVHSSGSADYHTLIVNHHGSSAYTAKVTNNEKKWSMFVCSTSDLRCKRLLSGTVTSLLRSSSQ
ncbi:uncharacterized protein ARMOST_16104 [Armillaria ostoyae]|uniref:Uncharacterized protein n=1 Tax=Armillaria ostoyae TaxID=47428 RepID=A0A284RV84_ARMOS|nr:uncharacterized protein ARMOST_16104 [Armillaria ostoyae]